MNKRVVVVATTEVSPRGRHLSDQSSSDVSVPLKDDDNDTIDTVLKLFSSGICREVLTDCLEKKVFCSSEYVT